MSNTKKFYVTVQAAEDGTKKVSVLDKILSFGKQLDDKLLDLERKMFKGKTGDEALESLVNKVKKGD